MAHGELPPDWKILTGNDLFTWSSGKGLTQAELCPGNIPVYGGNGINGYHDAALVKQPTLLIGRVGALCGNVYITSGPAWITDNAIYAKTMSDKIDLRFAKLVFSEAHLNQKSTGSGQPFVNQRMLNDVQIPLPSLPEQQRIVSKIEELNSQVDAGMSALSKVQVGLRRYKSSVLKAAVEGKLLETRELENRGELPDGWKLARIEEIAETIGGVTKGRNFLGKKTVMLPYLRVANVQRGRLDLEEMKEIELLESEIDKYRLRDGDVVLTEGGDWDKLGRSAVWRNQIELCVHQNHIFRARVKHSQLLPEWLMYFTNSEVGQNYFKEAAKQTTNLASVNLTQLRNCPVHLPPLEEQRRIVAEVERRLSVARQVENAVEQALARASRLRQAVLKSAFEGKLK